MSDPTEGARITGKRNQHMSQLSCCQKRLLPYFGLVLVAEVDECPGVVDPLDKLITASLSQKLKNAELTHTPVYSHV